MVLKDFLLPQENIEYQSLGKIKHLEETFKCYITNQRLLLYRIKGLLLKKEKVIAERLENIIALHYEEIGILRRKGFLSIEMPGRKLVFEGSVRDVKAIWKQLEKHTKPPVPKVEVKEKETIREVVMIRCDYCGALMPETTTYCPNCGAKRA
ncbi:MAG: zinc ribbon domain-containing protein [Candidatus Bathyarchaeia archaeon]